METLRQWHLRNYFTAEQFQYLLYTYADLTQAGIAPRGAFISTFHVSLYSLFKDDGELSQYDNYKEPI